MCINMKQIILASGSPRRHELLELLKIPHIVIPCKEEEDEVNNNQNKTLLSIQEQLIEVATKKVLCVEKTLERSKKNSLIIGADTIVILDEEIIGKPKSKEDAFKMLKKIVGKTHIVLTGLCVLDVSSSEIFTAIEKTEVSIMDMTDAKIKAYINTENILDKAGSYAIQGIGAAFINNIKGCFYNVMGFPLSKLIVLLKKAGYNYLEE
ncbi:MAG: septum formation protein Maf [Asgard group archaeon]|nr:septum formation protein Maf [Asgard group archaeon]